MTGQYQLEARLVALFDDGTVRLQKTNWRWVRIRLAELSQADQLLARGITAPTEAIAMNRRSGY